MQKSWINTTSGWKLIFRDFENFNQFFFFYFSSNLNEAADYLHTINIALNCKVKQKQTVLINWLIN